MRLTLGACVMITSALLRTETERRREEYTISRPAKSYRWVPWHDTETREIAGNGFGGCFLRNFKRIPARFLRASRWVRLAVCTRCYLSTEVQLYCGEGLDVHYFLVLSVEDGH